MVYILFPHGWWDRKKIMEGGGVVFLWMKKPKISSKGLQVGGWGGDKGETLLQKERLKERRALQAQRTSFPSWESPAVSKTADWSGKQGVTLTWPLPLLNRGLWWPYRSCFCREVGWNLIGIHWREEGATTDSSETVLYLAQGAVAKAGRCE